MYDLSIYLTSYCSLPHPTAYHALRWASKGRSNLLLTKYYLVSSLVERFDVAVSELLFLG